MTLFYYGCANADVMAAIDDPVLIEAFGIDDPTILESTNFTPLVTEEQRDAWTAMWERVQGGVALTPSLAEAERRCSGAGAHC